MPRDHPGRFMKTKNKDIQFFALPLEIRSIIYVYTFSDEPVDQDLGTQGNHLFRERHSYGKKKAFTKRKQHQVLTSTSTESWTLASKLCVLLTSKQIRAEATPFLCKCHTFRLETPTTIDAAWSQQMGWTYNGFRVHLLHEPLTGLAPWGHLITRIELGDVAGIFESSWDMSTAPNISRLTAYAGLRFLRLYLRPAGTSCHCVSLRPEVWNRLLTQLDELQLVIQHCGDEAILFRQAIAPESRWVQKRSAIVVPLNIHWRQRLPRALKISLWSLQRFNIARPDIHQVCELLDAFV